MRPLVASAMKAVSQLRKMRCQGFLVNITEKKTPELTITDVPVVRDFADVLTNDLPRVPTDSQVEFTIYLVPRAVPISKVPYRMAPKELQELNM